MKLVPSWILAFELSTSVCFQPLPFYHLRLNKRHHGDGVRSKLFPMNFERHDGSTKNPVKTEDVERDEAELEQKDSDIAAFFQGLGQWPLYPSSSEISVKGQANELEKSQREDENVYPRRLYRDSNPLTNLVKLEVILDLADGVKVNETEQYFSSIISVADQLFKASSATSAADVEGALNIPGNAIRVGDLLQRDKWADPIQSLTSLFESTTIDEGLSKAPSGEEGSILTDNGSASIGQTAEAMVRVATSRLETIMNEAAKGLSPNVANDLVLRAVDVFANGTTSVEQLASDIVSVARKTAKTQGLDVQYATERAKDATKGVSTIVNVANRVFGSGYAYGYSTGVKGKPYDSEIVDIEELPLFADYDTAGRVEQFQYESVVASGGVMGILSGAIYEDTIKRVHGVGHSLVANGTTADVAWMVTDSVESSSMFRDPIASNSGENDTVFVRSITLRGFDASDDTVDRERLLNNILRAAETLIDDDLPDVLLHSGLLGLATEIYDELKKYIEWASPNQKIVINGHSIGGSLSTLLLFLMTMDKGVEFVEDRVLRVFSFGSPPIARLASYAGEQNGGGKDCPVLAAFGLPTDIVYGYVQPYDPIVRLFTEYDPLYPLVDDLGPDETTLYYSGPARSLRPIARALFQAWEGWPEFRDSWLGANKQYRSVGVQHILLPEPLRYLNDRFFATNIGVPPVDALVQISSRELLPALEETFPLDVFQISLVPQATRSFLHHFYPAYDSTMENFATKLEKDMREEGD